MICSIVGHELELQGNDRQLQELEPRLLERKRNDSWSSRGLENLIINMNILNFIINMNILNFMNIITILSSILTLKNNTSIHSHVTRTQHKIHSIKPNHEYIKIVYNVIFPFL